MSRIYIFILFMALINYHVNAEQTCVESITRTTPSNTFIISDDNNTVLDRRTNLVWTRCIVGTLSDISLENDNCDRTSSGVIRPTKNNWQTAMESLDVINSRNFGGYNDWRLPNIKELETIIERSCSNTALNQKIFPEPNIDQQTIDSGFVFTHNVLSSSPLVENALCSDSTGCIWGMNLNTGQTITIGKSELAIELFVRDVPTP